MRCRAACSSATAWPPRPSCILFVEMLSPDFLTIPGRTRRLAEGGPYDTEAPRTSTRRRRVSQVRLVRCVALIRRNIWRSVTTCDRGYLRVYQRQLREDQMGKLLVTARLILARPRILIVLYHTAYLHAREW